MSCSLLRQRYCLCHCHADCLLALDTWHLQVMIYHMQCIFATGQMRTHLQDVLLAALMLFNDFVALFMLTFYWRPDSKNK